MSSRRAWWPLAPITNAKTMLSPPLSTLLSPLPPSHLWPHHAIPGNSSTFPVASTSSNNSNFMNNTSQIPSPDAPTVDETSCPTPSLPPPLIGDQQKLIEPIRPLYVGIFLSGPSTHRLLDRYPPHHATIYAHHVTLEYFGYNGTITADVAKCLDDSSFPLGSTVAIGVVGCAADDRCQAVEVTIPSWVQYNNATVPSHVTVSVVESGEAKEAGVLIKERKSQGKIEPVHGLRVLHGIVGVCLTDRRVVYSQEEFKEAVGCCDDHNTTDSDSGGGDEVLPPPPPQPSDLLLNNLENTDIIDNNTSCSSTPAMVDLVSLLHQCFAPSPSGAATTQVSSALSPPAPLNADDAVQHLITNRGPNSRQQLSRQNSRINNNKSKRRPTAARTMTAQAASSSSSSVAAACAVAVSNGTWWKTSSVKVTSKAAANYSIQKEEKPQEPESEPQKHRHHTAFQLDVEAAETERATMNAHHTAYKTALFTSKQAKHVGNHASARHHALIAHRHASAFLAARQRSSAAAFHAHNAAILNTFKLDLHGMHVKEAVTVLKKYIEGLGALQHPGGVLLKIVTGFGRHSTVPGRAKVLPAVVQYLAEVGVLFDVEEENPGMVRVLLEPQWSS
jgi:Smr domain